MTAKSIKLGMIGDNIAEARSPDLHRIAGELCGVDVSFSLLVPREMGKDFDGVFDASRDGGYRGVVVTYPYKQLAAARVTIDDPMVRRIGAVNVVVFGPDGAKGFNTDYSGFVDAYRASFGEEEPGVVAQIGAGGVGRAIAFALVELGVEELRLVDIDAAKAQSVADAVRSASEGRLKVTAATDATAACDGADAVVNCTPVGMTGHPGSPVPAACLAGKRWAFDAIYTPPHTEFRGYAEKAGARFLGGYELLFHQGVRAFRDFTGIEIADPAALRRRLDAVMRS